MTSSPDTIYVTNEIYSNDLFKHRNLSFVRIKSKHVFKSKGHTNHIRCNKDLKRKLKKYKLRHDGKEDQDVIDVSNFLVRSLQIKSPNTKEQQLNNIEDIEYIRPKNYLFKMGRSRQKYNNCKSVTQSKEKPLYQGDIDEDISSVKSENHSQKQTNAFDLLMDSRNKVIGSNSPGKERCTEEVETSKAVEKKDEKAKRLLLLQKMAEAKGSLKKREMEEQQEKHIKRKMEQRANKLKTMILKSKPMKINKNSDKVENIKHTELQRADEIKMSTNRTLNTLQLVNIFNECEMQMKVKSEKKQIPKDDEDFLNKLSPSIKKKENMLSYFKKIEKDTEIIKEEHESDSPLIKVKLKATIKKSTKRKCSINKNNEVSNESVIICDNDITINKADNVQKSNINEQKENVKTLFQTIKSDESALVNDKRPKRSIKRPVKYIDDSYLSDSDEEWNIFTPKKKRTNRVLCKINMVENETKDFSPIDNVGKSKHTANNKKVQKEEMKNKPVTLAPIFATKPHQTSADIEARQKFLQSGVPEQLKKKSHKQDTIYSASTCFPVTVHIKQNNESSETITHRALDILIPDINGDSTIFQYVDGFFKSLIHISEVQSIVHNGTINCQDTITVLKSIKQLNQRFPVYRTYHLLKEKCRGQLKENSFLELDNSVEIINSFTDYCNEIPEQLNWTLKYKPKSSKEIIGNFESVRELRKWLVQWTENAAKKKLNSNNDSDFSDFYQSDTDSRESMKATNNLLIITGPVGCGKTSAVYAVAAELAMQVLEVNASSKRNGKIMLQDLHEATQSHKVNRGTSSTENSQKSQDVGSQVSKKYKQRGRPKKLKKTDLITSSQDSTRTAMSVILIDDADIVFEQDDGFCSAIVQLVQCSKRPVILIASTTTCSHLQKFLQIGKIIKMNSLIPRMLGTWLDILCLVNNNTCWPGLGAMFLDHFKGDIRKTINYLQFYTQTETSKDATTISLDVNINNQHFDDEKSNLSWADQADNIESDVLNSDLNQIWKFFTGEIFDLTKCRYPIPLFNIWWNIPKLLNAETVTMPYSKSDIMLSSEKSQSNDDICKTKETLKDLQCLASTIDAISVADLFDKKKEVNDICLVTAPWLVEETHSVSEQDNVENYTRAYELSKEISHEYVKDSIKYALSYEVSGNLNTMHLNSPRMKTYREKDRIISRHTSLNNCLNPSAILDKRSLALDYWSTCRTICRIEKAKTDNNSKRNNRFCHYLKSVSANCKSISFDSLSDSLCFKDSY